MASRPVHRILASLAIAAALLVGLELVLRGLGWHQRARSFRFQDAPISGAGDGRHRVHPERFYALAPDYRHAPGHAGPFATGSWPFRGRPAEPAPPGIARVVLAGDSCVYGFGLPVAQTLAERLQERLARAGWDATRVQVLDLGTNGYSTVQIDLVVEEALERWKPEVVVVWPAAWNDQAPAMRTSDVELLARGSALARFARSTATAAWLRHLSGRDGPAELPMSLDEIRALADRGRPPFGTRVPAELVEGRVRATLERCAAAGARAVAIASAHPLDTRTRHPRVLEDADAVRRAARAEGVALVDAAALFAAATDVDASGVEPLFLDFVHPTPPAVELIADALAPEVLDALGPAPTAPPPADAPRIRAVELPAGSSALGDQPLRVELTGWTRAEPLPVVCFGGAPLLDLHAVAESTVEGTRMANAAGALDLLVQTARGCALAPGAVRLELPSLEPVEGHPRRVRLRARPGDRALVLASDTALERPRWTTFGAFRLDDAGLLEASWSATAGEDGTAEVELAGAPADGPLRLQALVFPRGEPEDTAVARWSSLLALDPER